MAEPGSYDDIAGGLPPDALDLASLQYPWSTPAPPALQPGIGIPAAALDAAAATAPVIGPPTQDELAAHAMAAPAQPAPPGPQAAPAPAQPSYVGAPLPIAGPAGPPPFGPPPPTVAQFPDVTISTEQQPSQAAELAGDPLRTQPGAQGVIGQLAPTQILSDEEAGRAIANLPPERQAEVRAKLEHAKTEDFASKLLDAATANRQRAQQAAEDHEKASAAAAAKAAELERDYKALAATKIDTSGRMGIGQRIAGILASVVGGLVSGRTGGPNVGLQMLQHTIDADVEAQKADVANRRGILGARQTAVGEMFARTGDTYRAQETARAAAWETTIQQLQAEQMKFDPRGTTSLRIADAITQARGTQQAGIRAYGQQQFKNYLDISKENREGLIAQSTLGKNAADITHTNAETQQILSKLGGGTGSGLPSGLQPGQSPKYTVWTGFVDPFTSDSQSPEPVMGLRQIGGKGEDPKERNELNSRLSMYKQINDAMTKMRGIATELGGGGKGLDESVWSKRKTTLGTDYDATRDALASYLNRLIGDRPTQGQLELNKDRIPERASVFEARDPVKLIDSRLDEIDRSFAADLGTIGVNAAPTIAHAKRARVITMPGASQQLDDAQAAVAAHPDDKNAQAALAAASQRVRDDTATAQQGQQDIATVRGLPPPESPLPELEGRPVAEAAAVKEANRAGLRVTQLLQRFHAAAGDTSYRKGLKPGELAAVEADATTKLGGLAREILGARTVADQERTKAAGEIFRNAITDRARAAGIDPDEAFSRARLGLPIGDEQPTTPAVRQPEPNPLVPNASYLPGADPFGPPVNSSQALFPPTPPKPKPKKKGR